MDTRLRTVEKGQSFLIERTGTMDVRLKSLEDGHALLCGELTLLGDELTLLGDELTCQAVRPLMGIPIVRAASDIR